MTIQEKYLKIAEEVIEKGPYKPDWLTFSNYEPPVDKNAKFGIFIHWGLIIRKSQPIWLIRSFLNYFLCNF